MGGMLFAVIGIPNIVKFIERKTMTNAEKAHVLLTKKSKYKAKAIRKTELFKKRLNAILTEIENVSKSKKDRLTVTSMENCDTDSEIRVALNERKFRVYCGYEGKNSITIQWG